MYEGDGPRYTRVKVVQKGGTGVYGLGFLGAVIYYVSHASSFWVGVLGFVKALFWPGFLVYELLKFLHA